MVASPNLLFQVTPPGGVATDYTRYLAYEGMGVSNTITQNFGRQGDTATFALVDELNGGTPNVLIPPMSQVSLYDAIAGQTLFGGVCHTPSMATDGPLRREWSLNCTDYAFYGDNSIVQGTFYGMTVDQVVIALVQKANCGITAVPVSQGGFVAPGPLLPTVVINEKTLTDALRTLAQLAGQSTPYGWYVDERLRLHFYDATTAISSGVTFTTTPTAAGGGSTTEGHFAGDGNTFSYTWDGASIRNRTLVQGATQTITVPTTGAPTDTFRADGVSTSWPLRYTLTGSPLLIAAGLVQNLTVSSGGQPYTGSGWAVQQNSVGQWFLTNSAVPQAGTKIQIWYNYQVPIIAQANSYPSQALYIGPNGGVFAEFISDTSLTTVNMAVARAQRQRNEYAFAVERLSFNTTEEFAGWVRAGETFLVTNQWIPDSRNSYNLGLTNSAFICVANSITFGRGGYRQMQMSAVRL